MKPYERDIKDMLDECARRREEGAIEYGEESFYTYENLSELQEELYDVINYALFTLLQVEKIKKRASKLNLTEPK